MGEVQQKGKEEGPYLMVVVQAFNHSRQRQRQRQVGLQSQHGLHSMFQDNQDYTEKPYLIKKKSEDEKKKRKRRRKKVALSKMRLSKRRK